MLNIGAATPSRRLRATSHTRVRAAITAILATRADSGEVLHIRLRKGSANTSRGILRFTDELIARLDRPARPAPNRLRADSGEASGVARPAWIYDLRSTFSSNSLAAGIDVFELARVMGRSIEMIERHYGTLLTGAAAKSQAA
jgi:hypothetical protein